MSNLAALLAEVDVYDFDKTIYDGDCSLDFYLFCILRHPLLLGYLPFQLWHAVLFALGREDRTSFKSHFFVFVRSLKDIDTAVDAFWKTHFKNIKQWYLGANHASDVIISASPEFLLLPAANKLGVARLLATRMEPTTGAITGSNCRGAEKVARLKQTIGAAKIRSAYGDSLADLPILELAEKAYIVKRHKIIPLAEYRLVSRRMRRMPAVD